MLCTISTHKANSKKRKSSSAIYSTSPYCKICKKSFANIFCYRRHVDLAHQAGHKVFICRICECRFKKKSLLKTHLKTIHFIGENTEKK